LTFEVENAAEGRITHFCTMEGKVNGSVLLREGNYASVVAKSQQQSRCSGDALKRHRMAV